MPVGEWSDVEQLLTGSGLGQVRLLPQAEWLVEKILWLLFTYVTLVPSYYSTMTCHYYREWLQRGAADGCGEI